jgi:flagellin-like hook-associated protein FlgL
MVIGTTRFFQNNSELFSRLNEDVKSLQTQAGTGKAELKLSDSYRDVENLSAAEELRAETAQFIANSRRVQTDLENLDFTLDGFQNLLVRLQEAAVESGNSILSADDRSRFVATAQALKSEMLDLANKTDSFGNALFGGVSGSDQPFRQNSDGTVNYLGSAVSKEVKVSNGLSVRQNFAGSEVFQKVNGSGGGFSIFGLVDDFSKSLEVEANSGTSTNLFQTENSVRLELPDSGSQAEISFTLVTSSGEFNFTETIYGNDYSALVSKLNLATNQTGITATDHGNNQISLQGDAENLVIKDFNHQGMADQNPTLNVVEVESSITAGIAQKATNEVNYESGIADISGFVNQQNAFRTAGTYTVTASPASGGDDAIFEITVNESGRADVEIVNSGSGFGMSETITINDSDLGGGGAGNLQFNVNGVTDFTNRTTDTTFSIAANQYTTDGSGEGATFDVYIDDTGAATVTLTSGGSGFEDGDLVTIPGSLLSSVGANNSSSVTFEISGVYEATSNTKTISEQISPNSSNYDNISNRIADAFSHIANIRAEVSAHSRRAQDTEYNNQNLLDELQEDISKIEDADLAFLLTRIEMLMLQKDAAQATFTRIASKSLFDFLG